MPVIDYIQYIFLKVLCLLAYQTLHKILSVILIIISWTFECENNKISTLNTTECPLAIKFHNSSRRLDPKWVGSYFVKNYILAWFSNDSISVRRQQWNLRAQIYMPTKLFANGTSSDSSIFYDSHWTHFKVSLFEMKLSLYISTRKDIFRVKYGNINRYLANW